MSRARLAPRWLRLWNGPHAGSARRRRGARPSIEILEAYRLLSVITVTTASDNGDDVNPTPNSLRSAILQANANTDFTEIDFHIGAGGPETIRPIAPLPYITAPLFLNGTSQPGFHAANPVPIIQIDGALAGSKGFPGLRLETGSNGSTIRGLVVSDFSGNGIDVASTGDRIVGDFVGTNLTGDARMRNLGSGLFIEGANVQIDGNLISGNSIAGIDFFGSQAKDAVVQGNRIGTNDSGTAAMPNDFGIVIRSSAGSNIRIGGPGDHDGNIISGNLSSGISISTSNNRVEGNRIGTNAAGTNAIPNNFGVSIFAGTDNQIGGTGTAAGNTISGNHSSGIEIHASGSRVQGNMIGTDSTGATALPNDFGVSIFSGSGTLIGGTEPGAGNIISGNLSSGIAVNSSRTLIQGNRIGTNAAGTTALPNDFGVSIFAGSYNTIGGTDPRARNTISGNQTSGIEIGSSTNFVQGNAIGTNAAGTTAIPNDFGVSIFAGSNNRIGGTDPAARNTISGNRDDGVLIQGSSNNTSENRIQGNRIGTNFAGTASLPNKIGVVILSTAGTHNTIGGTTPGAGNTISGNRNEGIEINSPGNFVQGNRIGTNAEGTAPLSNNYGVVIRTRTGRNNTVGGTEPGSGNLISGNKAVGIGIGSSGNRILGNRIGTNFSGAKALPNGFGVTIFGGTNTTIGGTTPNTRNLISGNRATGIDIISPGNFVQGNAIGTNLAGTGAIPNAYGVAVRTSGGRYNTIGGQTPGAGNLIAFNLGDGVTIGENLTDRSIGNGIFANAIFSNGRLGINLGSHSPSATVLAESSAGPNRLQHAPTLTNATTRATGSTIAGRLLSTPRTTFRIEFFSNPTGTSQGKTYLGFKNVTTDANGVASFQFGTHATIGTDRRITATATDPRDNTSEFSTSIHVVAAH